MVVSGIVSINASREKVWDFLLDATAVSQCAPGIDTLDIVEPGKKFRVTASVGFGSTRARFTTDVEFLELSPPERATLKAHGTAPGSVADVTSEMRLVEAANGATELHWSADIAILGSLAGIANRLLGGVTQSLTGAFFNCVKAKIET